MDIITNDTKNSFQKITANFTGAIRHDKMGGRDYLVAPMIMLVESVCNGVSGPALYPAKEISKCPGAWNNKPVVVYHPQINGRSISACDPDVITTSGIGVIMNTRWEDNKLKSEAWLEISRMDTVDTRIMKAVENNEVMELSTGLFLEEDKTEGEFNGKQYLSVAKNFQPDHLALLPDLKGSCSVEDGAGFLRLNSEEDRLFIDLTKMSDEQRKFILMTDNKISLSHKLQVFVENEMSHENIRSLLGSALRSEAGNDNLWVEEVFDDFFIYEDDGLLFKRDYDTSNGTISLTGTAVEVVRVVEFRTKDGKFIGNVRKDLSMDKKELVDGLIANNSTAWAETDRDVLMAMDKNVLEKMNPVENKEKPPEKTEGTIASNKLKENKEVAENKPEEEDLVTNMSVKDYLDTQVPKEMRSVLQNALALHDKQKVDLIKLITTNKNNTFTEEFLNTKDVEELTNLASLAGNFVIDDKPITRFNYIGQGQVPEENITNGEALPLLTLEESKAS